MHTHRHRPADVLVRVLRTDSLDDPGRWACARATLGADEARVFTRLRSTPARRDYLGAHLLARLALAEFVSDEPANMQIVTGPAGRPVLDGTPGASPVSFCVSRADHVTACAVSGGYPIGIDVESVRPIGSDAHGVAGGNGSSGEHRHHLRRMLMIRALQEAIDRVTGSASGLPLESVTVDPTDLAGEGAVPAEASARSLWRFAIRRVTSDHIVAVAIRCPSTDIPTIQFGAAALPLLGRGPLACCWQD